MPFITVDLVGNEEVVSKFRNMPDKIFNRLGKAMQKLQLDMIPHRRRASDPDQNPSACAPGNDNSLMGISVSDLVALRAVFPVWDAVGHGTERYSHDLYGVVRVPREVAVYLLHNGATSCTSAALGRWRTMIPPRGLHDDH